MEADLAFRGIDLRDYWAPGGGPSRLSLRRLLGLIRALPGDSALQESIHAGVVTSKTDALKSRRDHYADKKRQQEEVGAGD